ncbi:hypothetical protein [Streptomyces hydrogenans]|uniref:hypothetical protein n=1 Tax=Streptomyces hydrogenans TaxID=1873719 RepID=UPI0035E18636
MGKNPTKPKARILAAGDDTVWLLEHLYRHGADRASGFRIQTLRQIMVQNHHRDAAGRLPRRTAATEDGSRLPPSSWAIVSPYDTRPAMPAINWKGFSAHPAEIWAPADPTRSQT